MLCITGLSAQATGWEKGAVWYQIFPDRYHNADRSNDQTAADFGLAWPRQVPEQWQIHPWHSDWYQLQPWEHNTGNGFYWETGLRRYGGDLQGVMEKLPYLDSLGIDAIYLNPVFESPSLHRYDVTSYHHIDDNLGPNPEEDLRRIRSEDPAHPATWVWTTADSLFLDLIAACHARGMRIILDGVFNHTGNNFWAFKDLTRNQQASIYRDWYTTTQWDDPQTRMNEWRYQGWYGVQDMPELKDDGGDLPEGFKHYLLAVLRRWHDPNGDGDPSDGIDGWRLDVADQVPLGFWRWFREQVKALNPQAYLSGEILWDEQKPGQMKDARPWLRGDAFDGVMNYRFARLAFRFFAASGSLGIDAARFVQGLEQIITDYGEDASQRAMNLTGSHDTARLASQIVNHEVPYDRRGHPGEWSRYKIRAPGANERALQRLMVAFQMTWPGAPMIYYGDEAGMWGGDDPDCRKPMVWPQLQYEAEQSHPTGGFRMPDSVAFSTAMFKWYRRLIRIRRDHPALKQGKVEILFAAGRTLVFERELAGSRLLIAMNASQDEAKLQMPAIPASVNLLTSREFSARAAAWPTVLPPYGCLILAPSAQLNHP